MASHIRRRKFLATLLGHILKGAKPFHLPVIQSAKFEQT